MANGFGIKLQRSVPHLVGFCSPRPAVSSSSSHTFPVQLSRVAKRGVIRYRLPRRVVLGIGVSFWSQLMNMAGSFGAKTFVASARQKGAIEKVLENVDWPEQFPFKEEDFQRFDKTPDSLFYEAPRFVTHIDDPAVAALTKYYSEVFPPSDTPGVALLDMCSSWVSHYPKGYKQARIVGMGMNEEELKRNPVLTDYVVQDLNVDPKLPFEDDTFDVITNVVSVDYLTKPIDVFKEMSRILKPGGLAIISFSNRCFFTKAISIWTSTGDSDHVVIVGAYFHYAGGFESPKVSVDYLTKPIDVFKEMSRILKPGGLAIISFSNRCFFTKAISIWTSTGDSDHVVIVGAYFHYAGGFESPKAMDISPNPGRTDPMYIVYSRKSATA
ncbi:S-adenosyl-L-methionine-dependent methyltransferases superfamily [Olea europaea subsp. europaea]|uniref:S-adenosyl-L-methionine-dependent methyltransferases superfamily n=1 Tax=Olea europaea subsp. europaea TaxID=158383 RepID=A0A8S0UEE4_OLEEU|nr:S-adenosyl-L-methionine-dependent methyltransferases superfamily [Olea europaea subsp. europaea]